MIKHIIASDGIEWWFKDNKNHRIDGPASVHPDGREFWYKDNK